MITVVGTGSWGTALAAVLANNHHKLCLYGIDPNTLQDLTTNNRNSKYLGDIELFDNLANITVSNKLEQAVTEQTQYILLAIPSEVFAEITQKIKTILDSKNLSDIPIIIATKGLAETKDKKPKWLHEIIHDNLGKDYPCCILSGPSFAKEVAKRQPTSVVVASESLELASNTTKLFHNTWFRVYTRGDVLGVELGGALKNILAFAVGCGEGLGFGCNARAAVITRGLHEMLSLGDALGVQNETLMGLSGLGDLVLTATDNQSRNKRFGIFIGQGMDIKAAFTKVGQHVASYETTRLIYNLVKAHHLDLPITTQSYKVLFENLPLEQAIANLAARPQKAE